MRKDGKALTTIKTANERLTRLSKFADLNNPEEIKEALSNLTWKNNTKNHVAQVYEQYLKYIGLTWKRPRYTEENGLPMIPTEQELDTLIASGQPRIATRLQILKETGARVGELDKLEWTHIDLERKTIYITAEKGSNSRILPISNKLIAMLNQLSRKNSKVFQVDKENFRKTYEALRDRTATKLNNPRLMKIHLHTFRHYKGTTEYHKTKDIMHVKHVLGHKNIESTMIYINLENAIFQNAQDEEYTVKVAKTIEEATKLLEAGFQYVTDMEGMKIFKKRKN